MSNLAEHHCINRNDYQEHPNDIDTATERIEDCISDIFVIGWHIYFLNDNKTEFNVFCFQTLFKFIFRWVHFKKKI